MLRSRALLLTFLAACGNDYATADGNGDAGAADSGSHFCLRQSSSPTFCSDFADGQLPGPWSEVLIKNGGSIDIEQEGLVARYVANANGATASVHRTGLPVPKKAFDFSANMIVQDKGTGELDVLVARLPIATDARRELQVTVYATGKIALVSYLNGAYRATDDLGTFTVDQTTHVALHVDVATKRATVTIGGKAVGKGVDFDVANAPPEVFVGDASAATNAPWRVRFDEVVVQID